LRRRQAGGAPRKIGQTAAAMTDHGNIYGAVHFFDAMRRRRGSSRSSGASSISARTRTIARAPDGDKYNHLLVLAENEEGYRNLVRLTSEAALHGFYRKPRVSKNFLAKHTEGLIGFSGCLAGEVSST
jgi:DNA polymerase-3 subunit alpha